MAVVATLLLATLIPASAGASSKDTKKDLEAAKAKLNTLIDQIASERQVIQGIEANVATKTNEIEVVQGRLSQTQAAIVKLEADINTATLQLLNLQRQLDRRAAVAYENGPGSTFEFLLGSSSLSDLSDRLEIVDHAAQSDQALIDQMRDERAALQTKQQQKEKLKKRLRADEDQLLNEKAADKLNADRSEAEGLVTKLEKMYKKERAAEAAAAAARLAAALNASNGGSTEGAVGHPFHVCPVDQPRAYGDDYGAPRYGGGFHPHAGNDIFAPMGTYIRAPFNGTASDASNSLGGLSVYVYGPDGYVYNAHLSAIGRLGPVSAGDVIGYVGNTGDAQGGATHDHFEWHPFHIPPHPHVSPYGYSVINGGIDPYPYLNQVC
jgi:peptidoglycan hydrolase CwlO-like protein